MSVYVLLMIGTLNVLTYQGGPIDHQRIEQFEEVYSTEAACEHEAAHRYAIVGGVGLGVDYVCRRVVPL
jgi:hypothetical protein